jgi:hypothetical protein
MERTKPDAKRRQWYRLFRKQLAMAGIASSWIWWFVGTATPVISRRRHLEESAVRRNQVSASDYH